MSTIKKELLIFQNLPPGGAKSTYLSTSKYLSKKYKTKEITEPKYRIKNFLNYLYILLIKSPINQRRLVTKHTGDVLLCYQTWLGNTPSIIRYFNKKIIYICHEPPREFYDEYYICNQTLKEKIVNLIRYPIKILDKYNITSKSVIVVANSNFSKRWIDSTYNVHSRVVYPGINLNIFKNTMDISKKNQIITTGAINLLKNQLFLVEILRRIPHKIRPTLVLISNGSSEQYLKRLYSKAKKFHVRIKVLLNITEKEKILELKKSKIFIYSPINEPFGISLIEGIAVGLPIVVYGKGGGFKEVISSKNGLIIDSLSAVEWSEKLRKLLIDDSRMRSYSEYNLKHCNKYSEEIMNKNIESIISEDT